MDKTDMLQNELFISKVRWLTIFGSPLLLLVLTEKLPIDLIIVTLLMILYNSVLRFYFLIKTDATKYFNLFSIIDIVYLLYIYLHTMNGNGGLPQVFYFLILVMGIRYGLVKYHWIVIINSLLYFSATVAAMFFFDITVNSGVVLIQVLFFFAFGVMSSYILKRDYQQQLEKEELITELQAAYQQLCVYNAQVEEMANTDPLTGLYNYRYFTERLEQEMELSKKFARPLSLIIIDIDHFKDFNDTYGHPLGDKALKDTAAIFKQRVRDKDVLARYGGEEFLILLPATGIEEAFKCAERIREAIQHNAIELGDGKPPVKITVSGGVACYPVDADNGEQLLRIADEVLYAAKHKGRNMIHRRW